MTTQPRSTKEVITPQGKKIVVHTYLTTGELRKVQAMLMDGVTAGDMTKSSDNNVLNNVSAPSIFKAQDVVLEMLVVSIDGDSVEPYKKILELEPSETEGLFDEALEHLTGNKLKKNESVPSQNT